MHATPTRSPRRPRQAGFSFIEILIVMGIISVLVGGIIVAIGMWTRKGPEFATKNTIDKTRLMIEDWKAKFEMYPPCDVTRIAVIVGGGLKAQAPDNSTNEGIESVYQALYWPGFTNDPEWSEDETCNLDEDKLRKAVNKHGTAELMEIRDAWGNPLVYFSHDDYVRYADTGCTYLNVNLDDVVALPYRREDGTFYNPASFQLYSMGEDGEPNTDDDVLPWDR